MFISQGVAPRGEITFLWKRNIQFKKIIVINFTHFSIKKIVLLEFPKTSRCQNVIHPLKIRGESRNELFFCDWLPHSTGEEYQNYTTISFKIGEDL